MLKQDNSQVALDVTTRSTVNYYNLEQLSKLPPKVYIIDQVLCKHDIAIFFGEPGIGKSFVMIDLLISAALGKPFANRFEIPKPLSVVYCPGEGFDGLMERFGVALKYHNADNQIPCIVSGKIPQFYDKTSTYTYKHFVADWKLDKLPKIDLLVVDTLHSATIGAEENSNTAMAIPIDAAKYISNELDCAVVFVHHTNKGGKIRGASCLIGDFNVLIGMEKINDVKAQLVPLKLRDSKVWDSFVYELVSDDTSAHVEWSSVENIDVWFEMLKSSPGVTTTEFAKLINTNQKTATKKLTQLCKDGLVNKALRDTNKPENNRYNPFVYQVNGNAF